MSNTKLPKDFDPETYRKDAEALGETVAEYTEKGYLNRLKKSHVSITRAFQEQYTAINYQRKFGIIEEEAYYDKLAAIRDRFFAKNTQEWYKYTEEIYDYKVKTLEIYESAVKEDLEALAKEVETNFSKTIESYQKAIDSYSNMLEKSVGSGKGFDTRVTKVYNWYPTGDPLVITDYTLSDLDSEIATLKAFDEAIRALKERAADLNPEDFQLFFDSLRSLSMEDASRLTQLLLDAEDTEFRDYIQKFRKKHDLSQSVAKEMYREDLDAVASQIKASIQAAFSEVPEDFFTYGELTAEQFTQGFNTQIKDLFSGIEAQLKELTGFGIYGGEAGNATNHYTTTYYLGPTSETIAQQLIAARNHDTLTRLRQGDK